jgi:cell division protein ZapA
MEAWRKGGSRAGIGTFGACRPRRTISETVCDDLLDAGQRIRALEEELKTLRDVRVAAVDRAKATQAAVANALNAAAERIEKTTQLLNRIIGSGVAIG